jgi:hypothetical protein
MARFCELSIGPSNISSNIAGNTQIRKVDFERLETRCCRFVMPGLVPGIHVFLSAPEVRRGWPGQARP